MTARLEAPGVEPLSFSGPAAAAVQVRSLEHRFGALEVLCGISFALAPGEVLGLVGPSGCGKSTLLELVAGLREPSAGEVRVAGRADSPGRLEGCAYMPQRDLLLPWLSALDNAALALRVRRRGREQARALALPLFAEFGLEGFERARPAELSGGMRQRVAFLRTVLAHRPVLLLDEPFGSLDAIVRGEMQQWLAGALEAKGLTALLVTHDVEEAIYLCDRVLVLSPRPARVTAELEGGWRRTERVEAVAAPEFIAARQRALRALEREGA